MQRSRRAELVAEIRAHIDVALREDEATSEVDVRNVLERLGPPEDIVEAAGPPSSIAPAGGGKLELAALVVLVVPFVGWLFGSILVLASSAWSRREKTIAVALALAPVLLPLLGLLGEDVSRPVDRRPVADADTPDQSSGLYELAVLACLLVAGIPSALYLGWRLRRQPRTT